ncbi:MAG: hypothetical protein FJ280_03195 [Planctomycetes bacterium]|nr:hypothetical protein [Planctomycetota bacterium]
MSETSCDQWADRIVDYVDGELPQEQAQAVARHLAECDRCRQTAEALRRSLGLARALWQDNLAEATAVRSDAVRRSRSMGVPPMSETPNAIHRVGESSTTAVPAVCPTGILPVEAPESHGQDAHATHGQDAHATGGRDARDIHGRDAHATVCPYGHTTNVRGRRARYALAVAASLLLVVGGSFLWVVGRTPQRSTISFEEVQRQIARAGTAAQLLAATRLVAQCEGTESIVERQYRYILREYADTPAAESIQASYNLKLGGANHE